MNKNELKLFLNRIEGFHSLLEGKSLEDFQKEIIRVESFLKRFGSLDELMLYLEKIENMAYTVKDFLSLDEVALYLHISKSSVYKMTSERELTVYKPNGKNIYILRSDLNNWIRRNPCLSNNELEKRAKDLEYNLKEKDEQKRTKRIGKQ